MPNEETWKLVGEVVSKMLDQMPLAMIDTRTPFTHSREITFDDGVKVIGPES